MKDIRGHHVGFIFDGSEDTPHHSAMLLVDSESIILEVPLLAPVTDAYSEWFKDDATLPSELVFRNIDHTFHISGLRFKQHKTSWTGNHGVGRIEADRVVKTGLKAPPYSTINALQTTLVGLPGFIAPEVFSFTPEFENNRIKKVTGYLEHKPSTSVPGFPEISLVPSFTFSPDTANLRHVFAETMNIETRFSAPTEWVDHARLHRKMQDLVSLAFWHPCDLQVTAAQRDDDPELSLGGKEFGLAWRPTIVPEFGRRSKHSRIKPLPKDKTPLFRYSDIGPEGLGRWFAEDEDLGQAMWVLSASLFREGGTVEVRLLQVGTALEALGYELAIRSQRLTKGKRDSTFYLTEALELVVNSTKCNLDKVLKGRSAAEWAKAFNSSYKGVKHADNPLPDASDAYHRAEEGTLLARLWLALHLGVDQDKVNERQASLHT